MKKLLLVFVLIVSVCTLIFAGGEQEGSMEVSEDGRPAGFPKKTIEVLLPVKAGASLDLHFRALEAAMDLGGPVAIVNMGGASQTLGITEASTRPGDGYNIACSAFAGLVIQPHVLDLPYSQADFRHIVALNKASGVSIASLPGKGLDTFDDLLAKFEKGESVTFTTSNAANVSHLAMLSVMDQLNIPPEMMVYVSYSGTAEVMTALLGGHVDLAIFDTDFLAEKVESGQMNCVVVLENERNPKIPDSASISEYGAKDMDAFQGFLWVAVPADTPDDIVEWFKQQMNEALMSDSYQNFLATIKKTMTKTATEEEITAALKKATDTYGALIRKYLK